MKRLILIVTLLLIGITAQAQMIGATNNQRTVITHDSPTTTHPLGFLAKIEVGNPTSVVLGYQFNPYIMAGAGISGFMAFESYVPPIPMFIEARFSTPNYKFAYFFDARICLNLNDEGDGTPFGFNAQIGIMYKRLSLGIGISFIDDGYVYEHSHYAATDLILPSVSISYDIPFRSRN